jgi:hypothetical protein
MFKTLITLAMALALAFVVNPSAEKHRDKIQAAMAERSPITQLLGLGALTALVSSYHSLGVGSYTAVNGKLISVGAYGMVYVMD